VTLDISASAVFAIFPEFRTPTEQVTLLRSLVEGHPGASRSEHALLQTLIHFGDFFGDDFD